MDTWIIPSSSSNTAGWLQGHRIVERTWIKTGTFHPKIISSEKFCWTSELALCQHDETDSLNNTGILRGREKLHKLLDCIAVRGKGLHSSGSKEHWFYCHSRRWDNWHFHQLLASACVRFFKFIAIQNATSDIITTAFLEMLRLVKSKLFIAVLRYGADVLPFVWGQFIFTRLSWDYFGYFITIHNYFEHNLIYLLGSFKCRKCLYVCDCLWQDPVFII